MAFAGGSVQYAAAGTYTLPLAVDAAGNNPAFTLYSHLQTNGAGTIAFDSVPAVITVPATPVVLAIPPAARLLTITGTPSVVLGNMAG
jgi:hypothetical protein